MPRIFEDVENELEIKKSRFITYLHRSESEEDGREFIRYIRKLHPNASHACTAMVIGNVVRSSDDGEPAGTAGRPMLDVLTKQKMDRITAVVVRYFGGTLLGKGGLVRAYSSSVQEALKKAELMDVREAVRYELRYGYEWTGKVDAFLNAEKLEHEEPEFAEQVTLVFYARKNQDVVSALAELSSGKLIPAAAGIVEKEICID